MKQLILLLALITFQINAESIVIGHADWPPYHTVDKNGKHGGSDYEIVTTVLDSMACSFTLQAAEWENQLHMLEAGRIHAVRGAGHTVARAKFSHYTLPYRYESFALYLIRTPQNDHLSDSALYKQFCSGKIKPTINKGYYYGKAIDSILTTAFKPKELPLIERQLQLIAMVRTGRVSSFIMETATANYQFSEQEREIKLRRIDLPPAGGIHLIFSKKSVKPEFVERYNAMFTKLLKNGTLAPIYRKYGIVQPTIK